MRDAWTGAVIGKCHVAEITLKELADEAGYSRSYVTMLLNGHRTTPGARQALENALQRIIDKRGDAR